MFRSIAILFLFSIIGCQSRQKIEQTTFVDRAYPEHWWKAEDATTAPKWEILPQAAKSGEVIVSKRNELGILSNFAPTPFTFYGKKYGSVEGLWSAMKYPENPKDLRAKFPGLEWPHARDYVAQLSSFEAKKAGTIAGENMKKMNINWVTFENRKIDYRVMEKGDHYKLIREAMMAKLEQNPEVRRILVSTKGLTLKPDHIQEEPTPPAWKYYEIWMEIRDSL